MSCASSLSLAGSLATVSVLPSHHVVIHKVAHPPLIDVGWLTGDIIAGLTVGMVLVPQSMSYATVNQNRRDL